MADVFLSYKREDRSSASIVARDLALEGFSVFYDVTISVGDTWDEVIERELDAARAVVVLWSERSRKSRWVRREAREGMARNILCPALIGPCRVPVEFSDVQAADLTHCRSGDREHPEWQRLTAAIRRSVGATRSSQPSAQPHGAPAQPLSRWWRQTADTIGETISGFASQFHHSSVSATTLAGLAIAAAVVLVYVGVAFRSIPSVAALRTPPSQATQVFSANGEAIGDLGVRQRRPVALGNIPEHVQAAFRAAAPNVERALAEAILTPRSPLLHVAQVPILERRLRENFTNAELVEIYLNHVQLGRGAWGVGAAARNYFDKPLSELSAGEAAYLAARIRTRADPVGFSDEGAMQRNLIVDLMQAAGDLTAAEASIARTAPLGIKLGAPSDLQLAAAPFMHQLQSEMEDLYERDTIRNQGLAVRTTLDSAMQLAGARALLEGLNNYDRRHAWRGAVAAGDPSRDIQSQLSTAPQPPVLSGWRRAMVTVSGSTTQFVDESGATALLPADDRQWVSQSARNQAERQLRPGSIIFVERLPGTSYRLRQVPELEAALVAMNPDTGAVHALITGNSISGPFDVNHAITPREPNALVMPIVYAAALQAGYTPATQIYDEPLAIPMADGSTWSPRNWADDYVGQATLRSGIVLSRDVMVARVAHDIGLERVVAYAERMGAYDSVQNPQPDFAIGVEKTTLMRLLAAYCAFANGGREVSPFLIERVQDRTGITVARRDQRQCAACNAPWRGQAPPLPPETRRQTVDPLIAAQITSILQDVVARGTATMAFVEGRPLAGRTATPNDYSDAWFIAYTPRLVIGVWAGFDDERHLGAGETGGRIAVPIVRDMLQALDAREIIAPFRVPASARLVLIDRQTGRLATASSDQTVLEIFRAGTEPRS